MTFTAVTLRQRLRHFHLPLPAMTFWQPFTAVKHDIHGRDTAITPPTAASDDFTQLHGREPFTDSFTGVNMSRA